jgi:subtilisin-like proprotein convertase family protein
VTYTRSGLGLAIPDNTGAGLVDSLTIADDFEIADLNIRLDNLTHTFVNDLNFGVRGPSGYGGNFLALTGQAGTGGGSADNFVSTVIDDEAANNLLTAANATAPYTNSYTSVFNAPTWTTLLGASPDATPQLSRFDGTSTLGTWRAMVSDQFAGDIGTWQGWSLIVTPRAFVCTGFVPTAANVEVSGMVTDSDGRAIGRASVTLTDMSGVTRSVRTNSFGYFRFDDIPAGQTYVVQAQAKGYSFEAQTLTVSDAIDGLELRSL